MNKHFKTVVMALVVILALSACNQQSNDNGDDPATVSARTDNDKALITDGSEIKQLQMPEVDEDIAVITTDLGVIKVRFFPEYAPKAVENFITHAKEGYYDGILFHRIIEGFMIQGGDPEGTGGGGESIWGEPFETEIEYLLHHIRGALSMAKTSEPVSQGSQFFIVQGSELSESQKDELQYYAECQDDIVSEETGQTIKDFFPTDIIDKYLSVGGSMHLDYQYTVFGQVFEGIDIVDEIAAVQTDENDKPVDDVKIISIVIEKYAGE